MPNGKQIAVGAGVLAVSVLSNVLLWFNLKYFVADPQSSGRPDPIRPPSYLLFQFGIVWTICMLIAAGVVVAKKQNREYFVQDFKRLSPKDIALMFIASGVAIGGFYLVIRWFTKKDSQLAKFVPMRQALAVMTLGLLGLLWFKEKINTMTGIGLGALLLGFIALFVGKFLTDQK